MTDDEQEYQRVRAIRVDSLGWPARVRTYFRLEGIETLGDILDRGLRAMLMTPNLGRTSANYVIAELGRHGLHFRRFDGTTIKRIG